MKGSRKSRKIRGDEERQQTAIVSCRALPVNFRLSTITKNSLYKLIVIHILEEPLTHGNCEQGQGLCEGLDTSLREVVVHGLITCEGVGFVRKPISLLAEYTVLQLILVELEGQQELPETEREYEEWEVGFNGELKVEE